MSTFQRLRAQLIDVSTMDVGDALSSVGGVAMKTLERNRIVRQIEARDEEQRLEAARSLVEGGDERAAEALIPYLAHDDEGVRDAASVALVGMGERAEAVVLAALDHHFPEVRARAAMILAEMNDPRAETLLLVLAREDGSAAVRRAAIHSLASIDREEIRDRLELLALRDPSVLIREVATEELDPSSGARATETLLIQLRDPCARIREIAARRLGEAAADSLYYEPLIDALGDEVDAVRKSVADTLNALGWRPTTEAESSALKAASWTEAP